MVLALARVTNDDSGACPLAACAETGNGTGVSQRQWTKASVEWDCNKGHGTITRKYEYEVSIRKRGTRKRKMWLDIEYRTTHKKHKQKAAREARRVWIIKS